MALAVTGTVTRDASTVDSAPVNATVRAAIMFSRSSGRQPVVSTAPAAAPWQFPVTFPYGFSVPAAPAVNANIHAAPMLSRSSSRTPTVGVFNPVNGAVHAVPMLARSASRDPLVIGTQPSGTLLWSDEFDGPAGSLPGADWNRDVGNWDSGATATVTYSSAVKNAQLDGNSNLLINILWDTGNATRPLSSARLDTNNHQMFKPPVRVQARIRTSQGVGNLWPAFWMDGHGDTVTHSWPQIGEIDIFENQQKKNVPFTRQWDSTTIHGPTAANPGADTAIGHTQQINPDLSLAFHVYGVDWYTDRFDFTFDGAVIFSITQAQYVAKGGDYTVFTGSKWPFFIILNCAGYNFSGSPVSVASDFPQTVTVDWVRVYQL